MDTSSSESSSEYEYGELTRSIITGDINIDVNILKHFDLKPLIVLFKINEEDKYIDNNYMYKLYDKVFKKKFKKKYGDIELMKGQTWILLYVLFEDSYHVFNFLDLHTEDGRKYLGRYYVSFKYGLITGYTNILDYILRKNDMDLETYMGIYFKEFLRGTVILDYSSFHKNTFRYIYENYRDFFIDMIGDVISTDNIHVYKLLYREYYDIVSELFDNVTPTESPRISMFLEKKGEKKIDYLGILLKSIEWSERQKERKKRR